MTRMFGSDPGSHHIRVAALVRDKIPYFTVLLIPSYPNQVFDSSFQVLNLSYYEHITRRGYSILSMPFLIEVCLNRKHNRQSDLMQKVFAESNLRL